MVQSSVSTEGSVSGGASSTRASNPIPYSGAQGSARTVTMGTQHRAEERHDRGGGRHLGWSRPCRPRSPPEPSTGGSGLPVERRPGAWQGEASVDTSGGRTYSGAARRPRAASRGPKRLSRERGAPALRCQRSLGSSLPIRPAGRRQPSVSGRTYQRAGSMGAGWLRDGGMENRALSGTTTGWKAFAGGPRRATFRT